MEQKISIDLSSFEAALALPDEEQQALALALQSIAKRKLYCLYHFDEFLRNSDPLSRLIDRFSHDSREPEDTPRIAFEAHALAFLHNVHALMDSLPYVLNIAFRKAPDIEDKNVSWGPDFIKKFKDCSFHSALENFSEADLFQQIKGFANRTKHKHLIHVRNKGRTLNIEGFAYGAKGQPKRTDETDLKDFMVACHDNLLKDYFRLVLEIQKAIPAESKFSAKV